MVGGRQRKLNASTMHNLWLRKMKKRNRYAGSDARRKERKKERRKDDHSTIATATAPPSIASISFFRPMVADAAPVCRLGGPAVGPAVAVATSVGLTTVMAVTVLMLPLGRVVVRRIVDVMRECVVVGAAVVWACWVVVAALSGDEVVDVTRVVGGLAVVVVVLGADSLEEEVDGAAVVWVSFSVLVTVAVVSLGAEWVVFAALVVSSFVEVVVCSSTVVVLVASLVSV